MAQSHSVPYHANLNYTPPNPVFVESDRLEALVKYFCTPGFSDEVSVAVATDVVLTIERSSHGSVPLSFRVSKSKNDGRIPSVATVPVKSLQAALSVFNRDIHLSVEGSSVFVSDERKVAVVYGKGI